jgi:[acyl-carrier-protein] S-malonyltransferase
MNKNLLFVFPGQGCQYLGIGKDIYKKYASVRDLYTLASDILGYDIAKLSFEGPEEQVNLTKFTQPVLVTHQIACYYALCEELGETILPNLASGHSLGEYTALTIAGSLTPEQAIALVAKRGELMSRLGQGAMLATTLTLPDAKEIAGSSYCSIAGINLPDQTVLAGKESNLEKAMLMIKDKFPKKRAIPLKTEGAFHSYLMVEAAIEFNEHLMNTIILKPNFSVLSNYTGLPHQEDALSIQSKLFFQLFSPVKWVDCMTYAFNTGVENIYEFGGGIGSGVEPSEKKPNLQSMMKKFSIFLKRDVSYCGVINVDSVLATSANLKA